MTPAWALLLGSLLVTVGVLAVNVYILVGAVASVRIRLVEVGEKLTSEVARLDGRLEKVIEEHAKDRARLNKVVLQAGFEGRG